MNKYFFLFAIIITNLTAFFAEILFDLNKPLFLLNFLLLLYCQISAYLSESSKTNLVCTIVKRVDTFFKESCLRTVA